MTYQPDDDEGLIDMTARLTTPCTICGICPCPIPASIEVDPICACCIELNSDHPDYRPCPGYGEYCGNPLDNVADLCGDCAGARRIDESPRIPR